MISPPKPSPLVVEAPLDPEALIEEARRRSRRRRRRISLAASVMVCVGVLPLALHGWGDGGSAASPTPSPRVAVSPSSNQMANGPLTVIRQGSGHGGIYTDGRNGLG